MFYLLAARTPQLCLCSNLLGPEDRAAERYGKEYLGLGARGTWVGVLALLFISCVLTILSTPLGLGFLMCKMGKVLPSSLLF